MSMWIYLNSYIPSIIVFLTFIYVGLSCKPLSVDPLFVSLDMVANTHMQNIYHFEAINILKMFHFSQTLKVT